MLAGSAPPQAAVPDALVLCIVRLTVVEDNKSASEYIKNYTKEK